jgi:undecaprenyl-diphosphatase
LLEQLKNIDTQVFLSLNRHHNSFFDPLFYYISERFIWIPLYIYLLYLIIKKYKRDTIYIVLGVIALIVLSDQISVLIKNNVQRLRPCHEMALKDLIHLFNNKCGGQYGFISSHASNAFGIAVFVSCLFKNRNWTIFLLSWATIVSFSRIYLGAHYPGDIIGGWILGTTLALLIYFLLIKLFPKKFDSTK